MHFDILTLFPQQFENFTQTSIIGRAVDAGHISITTHNIRDYTTDKHNRVDDTPYGGGAGMVMTCQPLWDCIHAVKAMRDDNAPVIYMTPQGQKFTQQIAEESVEKYTRIILLCGHYEGIDQRIRGSLVDAEWRIGDYVLSGGELAAQVVTDAISRLVPGVLGNHDSADEESFSSALGRKQEYPHYTKPQEFQGMKVPDILLSGHHAEIKKWQLQQVKSIDIK